MKASVETIRAAGFEWPKLDAIDRRLVLDGEQVDLDATRDGILAGASYYRHQLHEMQSFSDAWSAPMSEVSDRREEYVTLEYELVAAAAYVSEVISALTDRGRSPQLTPSPVAPMAPNGSFTREALDAHEQWIARGRRGAGRFSVENASIGALTLGTVKLSGARLVKVNLDRAHADFGDFSGAELIECTAIATHFAHTVFDGARLERCDFSRAHLGLTDFRDSVVTDGRFVAASADRGAWNRIRISRADLRELRFGDCVLDGAVLEDCDLRDASFDCVTPALDTLCSTLNTTFVRCDLRGASFEGRRLAGTRFIDCKFAGVKGKPRIEAPCVVERPDFSAAGDGSDLRGADAVHALWGE